MLEENSTLNLNNLTIDGGEIYIECNDDGLNAGGDGGIITINGGSVYSIGKVLKDNNLIRNELIFKIYVIIAFRNNIYTCDELKKESQSTDKKKETINKQEKKDVTIKEPKKIVEGFKMLPSNIKI